MTKKMLVLMLFIVINAFSQKAHDQYSFEGGYGFGISGKPGITQPSHFDIGFRYMLDEHWGVKFDYGSDKFREDIPGTQEERGTDYHRISFNVVHNLGRSLGMKKVTGSFNVLAHAGFGYSWITPVNTSGIDKVDSMGNVITGLTPQLYISKNLALHADFSYILNFSQHRDFNGVLHDNIVKGFTGNMANASLGITFYFGSNTSDADWR